MDARVVLLHLWAVLVLLTAELRLIDAAEIYTNTWAVQIKGGPEEAARIAKENGFISLGSVSCTISINLLFKRCLAHLITNQITPRGALTR